MKRLTQPGTRHLINAALIISMMITLVWPATLRASPAIETAQTGSPEQILSPIWKKVIRQWSEEIALVAEEQGLDPDFVAAVVDEESNGIPNVISRVGAVGLMGVMPSSPGLEWRPDPEALEDPITNLRWGTAILAEIIRQAGGDLAAALAAYSGGWDQINSRVTQNYAASVLDKYGRAVAARNGISPELASQWTIAIEIDKGYVPQESLLVLGEQPVSGLITYGEHIVYHYVDFLGRPLYIKGYAVPVALVVPIGSDASQFGEANTLEIELQSRLGQTAVKINSSNPRVLIACLPSLSRLRGRASTRWFAPSYCPLWYR